MNTTTTEPTGAACWLPFRLAHAARASKLAGFNRRAEIEWFGFSGRFGEAACAEVAIARPQPGLLGGGAVGALNGGVIAAGFDAACVLAALGHFDSDVVVTLELSVQFLSLARTESPLVFRAGVTRSSRNFAFAQGLLGPSEGGGAFATATALLAPVTKAS